MTAEQRVSRLEESTERIEGRIDRLEDAITKLRREINELRREISSRLNVQMQLNSAMWVTTVLGIIAILAAVVFRS